MKGKPSIFGVLALVSAMSVFAQNGFLVRPKVKGSIDAIAQRYGLTVVEPIDPQDTLYLVEAPAGTSASDLDSELGSDPDVKGIEPNQTTSIPELSQSTAAILDHLPSPSTANLSGENLLAAYVRQPAVGLIHLQQVDARFRAKGTSVVAIIDTGIDPNHPALRNSVVGGYDFVHNVGGSASEFIDLNRPNQQALANSSPNPDTKTIVGMVSQSTAAILDQSTAAILDKRNLPRAFGHGTMVAGIVHLVAPTAKLMPLKAFSGDGTASLSNILRAIYYGVDHHADTINMSFTLSQPSEELVDAIRYAHHHKVMCVAAAGNAGTADVENPANLKYVLGVASISNSSQRSKFSNYGAGVFVAAPGEGIVTTYPGNNYAEATGTSFSAPFVSGTAARIQQIRPGIGYEPASRAVAQAIPISPLLGHGLLDVAQTLTSVSRSEDGGGGGRGDN